MRKSKKLGNKSKKVGNKRILNSKNTKGLLVSKKSTVSIKKSGRARASTLKSILVSGFNTANKIIKNKGSRLMMKKTLTWEQYISQLGTENILSGGKASATKLVRNFISERVRSRTDNQASSAYDNLMNKFNSTVVKLNQVGGIAEKLDQHTQLYLNVMIDCNLIEDDKEGKYHLVNKPTLNDFLTVSDRYLEIKAALVKYFGDDEYEEAYGSGN